MRLPVHSSLLALAMTASAVALPSAASATDIQMWVRASGATAAQHMIDLWNASHDDKVVVTVIPDTWDRYTSVDKPSNMDFII